MWFWLENLLGIFVRPKGIYGNLGNEIIYMQIRKWVPSLLERWHGDQPVSAVPEDLLWCELPNVYSMN